MKLENAEIIKLLPEWMKEDAANQGLSAGIDPTIRDLAAKAELLKTWNQIDDLPEAELDELAWELNIGWYNDTASIETKRQLIRESDLVHARLGTIWAVKRVISAYFGDAITTEWFEYGGDPYYFRIHSGDTSMSTAKIEEFLSILEIVKRKSAWLEMISLHIGAGLNIYFGMVYQEMTIETHRILD
jgi:phage tail P2-like protein